MYLGFILFNNLFFCEEGFLIKVGFKINFIFFIFFFTVSCDFHFGEHRYYISDSSGLCLHFLKVHDLFLVVIKYKMWNN